MAQHGGYRQPPKQRMRGVNPNMMDPNQLFDDTSASQHPQPSGYAVQGIDIGLPMNNFLSEPVANVAMAYGTTIASQGKDMVHKELNRFVSINKLKYFFTVDTRYVAKKLRLLIFPYTHQNWELGYHADTRLTPREDFHANAPDLYIPTMAFITYILLAGVALGIQKRFSPEVLGMCASTALVWIIIEVLALVLALYLISVHTDLTTFDLIAYSGYKYVGIIFTILSGLLFGRDGYYLALAWTSCAIMFFLVRSLRMKVLSSTGAATSHSSKNRLRMYVTLALAAFQPIVSYWLTVHLIW
ncbi:protein YIF1A [Leucoraja erinacea]|uniref:protein YIF1A n=1 Tax=Leucoraja erinaceus TaxID=7782 RepID=UPI0024564AB5|nr:protein YIF1A [Leucoraja erinacea]